MNVLHMKIMKVDPSKDCKENVSAMTDAFSKLRMADIMTSYMQNSGHGPDRLVVLHLWNSIKIQKDKGNISIIKLFSSFTKSIV